MILEIFRKLLVLFICCPIVIFGQSADNVVLIELGENSFPIERPFTISVIVPNSETRPTIAFPNITGFSKKGTSVSITTNETGGRTITNQVITQTYQALAPGRFRLAPFVLTVNGETVRSEGATLIVRSSATAGSPVSTSLITNPALIKDAAFLTLRASKPVIYAGEGVSLTLSFFVADNYPYELNFTALDRQLQDITKKIRPANAWEENGNITELKPVPALIGNKKFREYRLYQAVFFPLAARSLALPAVSLRLIRRPVIGPPSAQPETMTFTSKPAGVRVRPLPPHPLRGRLPVGNFRLEEGLDRQRMVLGQSARYLFTISGEGNIAALPTPTAPVATADIDVFPPEEQHTLSRTDNRVTGHKTFTYFIVPHQNGLISLADRFQWIYFDPQTARYDTLRSKLRLSIGGNYAVANTNTSGQMAQSAVDGQDHPGDPGEGSIYAGIQAMDSTRQPINTGVLIRAIANVLIVLMLLGMVFVFFKK